MAETKLDRLEGELGVVDEEYDSIIAYLRKVPEMEKRLTVLSNKRRVLQMRIGRIIEDKNHGSHTHS